MPRINPDLLAQLEKRLNVSRARVYALIQQKAAATFLPRHLAAIAVAADSGISTARYASAEELAEVRGVRHAANSGLQPVHILDMPSSSGKGTRAAKMKKQRRAKNGADKRVVFVVHGRDEGLRRSMFSFLRAIGLEPLEWSKAMAATKRGSPYVGDVLDAAFQTAKAVVVLLSGDDEARLRKQFIHESDSDEERSLTPQARPNVLFEAGMAFGRQERATVLVQVGPVRKFSDVIGRHAVRLDNSATKRKELADKLKTTGCPVDTDGHDWLTVGDFDRKPKKRRKKSRRSREPQT